MATTTRKSSWASQSKSKTVNVFDIRKGRGKTNATQTETKDEVEDVEAMQVQLEALSRQLRKSKASWSAHQDAQRQGELFFFIQSTAIHLSLSETRKHTREMVNQENAEDEEVQEDDDFGPRPSRWQHLNSEEEFGKILEKNNIDMDWDNKEDNGEDQMDDGEERVEAEVQGKFVFG